MNDWAVNRRIALVCWALGVLVVAGCSNKLDPTEPGEAYLKFRKSLKKGDVEQMWKRCSPSTREYFNTRYDELVQMDHKIHKYLPQTDHKLARKQSGTVLLDEIDSGRGLFEHVVDPEKVAMNEARRLGSLISAIRLSKDEKQAEVETRSGRKYRLVKGEESEWYVSLVDSLGAVDKSFAWLERNKKALDKTVQDLSEEQRKKREEIIAELMDVD